MQNASKLLRHTQFFVRKLDSASGFRRVIATHRVHCYCSACACACACFLATSRDLISSPPTSATPFKQTIQHLNKTNLQAVRQANYGAFGIFRCSQFGFIYFFYYFLIFLLSTFYVRTYMHVLRLTSVLRLQHACLSGCRNEWSFCWFC